MSLFTYSLLLFDLECVTETVTYNLVSNKHEQYSISFSILFMLTAILVFLFTKSIERNKRQKVRRGEIASCFLFLWQEYSDLIKHLETVKTGGRKVHLGYNSSGKNLNDKSE